MGNDIRVDTLSWFCRHWAVKLVSVHCAQVVVLSSSCRLVGSLNREVWASSGGRCRL